MDNETSSCQFVHDLLDDERFYVHGTVAGAYHFVQAFYDPSVEPDVQLVSDTYDPISVNDMRYSILSIFLGDTLLYHFGQLGTYINVSQLTPLAHQKLATVLSAMQDPELCIEHCNLFEDIIRLQTIS